MTTLDTQPTNAAEGCAPVCTALQMHVQTQSTNEGEGVGGHADTDYRQSIKWTETAAEATAESIRYHQSPFYISHVFFFLAAVCETL